jgi:hypothetical protein
LNKKSVKAHVYADGSENPTAEYWELLMEMIETCLMDRPAADNQRSRLLCVNGGDKAGHMAAQKSASVRVPSAMARALSR